MQHALLREYHTLIDDDAESMTLFFMYSSYVKDMQDRKQAQEAQKSKRAIKKPIKFGG